MDSRRQEAPVWNRGDAIAFGVVLLSTLWVFAPVGRFGFVSYDDPTYVAQNPWVHAGLSWEGIRWALSTLHFANWHPLTWLSYMLDVEVFGLDPGAMHLVNVALHLANACLVHAILRLLGAGAMGAGFVAALFALHPLHVESVAWISERKGLLSTFFGLIAIALYIHWVRGGRHRDYIGCFAALALGLATKPMLVSWPLLLLLLDWGPLGRIGNEHPCGDLWRCFTEKLPLFALSAASCVVTVLAQSGSALIGADALPIGPRLENALVGYAEYLRLTVWPDGLSVLHPHPKGGIPLGRTLVSAGLLFGITLAVLGPLRHWRALTAGWLWYGIALVPVIGIVQVGSQAIAERYTYVPLIGPFAALVWAVGFAAKSPRARSVVAVLGGVVLVALAFASRSQVDHWRSSRALFEHAVAVTGPNFVARLHLGSALLAQGSAEGALSHYRAADRIEPGHPLAILGMASALAGTGRTDEALVTIGTALQEHPEWPEGHATLGNLHLARGEYGAARDAFQRAVRLSPELAEAHNGLGAAIASLGDPRAAIPHFERALELQPGFADAERNLALARNAQAGSARP